MDIRKIAVIGGFTVGAALALAPIAAADPTEITTTVDSEISSLNALFTLDTDLAGVPATDVTLANAANPFDIITPADITAVQGTTGTTPFDFLTYGVDPSAAGLSSDPGSYDVLNGALGKFDDAFNVELYALENNGALDPNTGDFIGSMSSIDAALATGNPTGAAEYFLNFGLGDLQGYFDPSSGASPLSDLGSLGSLGDLGSLGGLGDGLTGLLGDLGSLGGSLF
jgi:hypothetical protein